MDCIPHNSARLTYPLVIGPWRGRRRLVEHLVAIEVLREALTQAEPPHAHPIAAVHATHL